MSSTTSDTPSSEPTFAVAPLDAADVVGILKRGWLPLSLCLLAGLTSGFALTRGMPVMYSANVRLVLEHNINRYLQSNRAADGPTLGDDSWSQTHILSSEAVLLPVIEKLKLTEDPEFGGAADDNSQKYGIRTIIAEIKKLLGTQPVPAADRPSVSTSTYRAVNARMSAVWEAQPIVMNVYFSSKDPAKAALIANEIAESYINYSIESKRRSAQMAAQSLQDRLSELRNQAAHAERQVVDFRLANNVVRSETNSGPSERTSSFNSSVSSARIALHDARARLEVAQLAERMGANRNYIPDTAFITRLREQAVDVETRARDMEGRVGKSHAASRQLRKRLEEISTAIVAEQKRVASSYASEYEVAKARFDELSSAVVTDMTDDSANSAQVAKLRELESSAQSLRVLYNTMLARVNDENRFERQLIILPDARVLSRASVPDQSNPSKKRMAVLGGSSALGLMFGAGLLLWRQNPIGVFRTPAQVMTSLGLKTVVVPKSHLRRSRSSLASNGAGSAAPHSRFSQSFQMIWAQLRGGKRHSNAKVIGIVSALPNEGKTTVAINLANEVASQVKIRTLLIDTDMHRQSLTREIAPSATVGLAEAWANPERLADFVVKSEESGVDVLPCPMSSEFPSAAQLLGSKGMEDLIARARATYDLVIVEIAPAAAAADLKMLSPLCDGFVYVVEWSVTSQRIVLETFSEITDLWERVACVVLNKADPKALKSIEHYKGKQYHSYYG